MTGHDIEVVQEVMPGLEVQVEETTRLRPDGKKQRSHVDHGGHHAEPGSTPASRPAAHRARATMQESLERVKDE